MFSVRFCTGAVQRHGENERNKWNEEVPGLVEIPDFSNFHQNKRNHGEVQGELSADPSDDSVDAFGNFILLKMGTNGSANASSGISFDCSQDETDIIAGIEAVLKRRKEAINDV